MSAMKKILLFAFFALFLLDSKAFPDALDLTGRWEAIERSSDSSTPQAVIDLSLTVDKSGSVQGSYCFVTQHGNRIDCGNDEGTKNISGHLVEGKPEKAIVEFSSFFGAKKGIAEIKLSNEASIDWDVLTLPQGGDFYGPEHAVLHRVTKKNDDIKGKKIVVVKRAYLYDEANTQRMRRGYLIKGDHVQLVKQSDDFLFWQIEFPRKNGVTIKKWIDCSDIDFCVNQAPQ
jgi:hypothetical protein